METGNPKFEMKDTRSGFGEAMSEIGGTNT